MTHQIKLHVKKVETSVTVNYEMTKLDNQSQPVVPARRSISSRRSQWLLRMLGPLGQLVMLIVRAVNLALLVASIAAAT